MDSLCFVFFEKMVIIGLTLFSDSFAERWRSSKIEVYAQHRALQPPLERNWKLRLLRASAFLQANSELELLLWINRVPVRRGASVPQLVQSKWSVQKRETLPLLLVHWRVWQKSSLVFFCMLTTIHSSLLSLSFFIAAGPLKPEETKSASVRKKRPTGPSSKKPAVSSFYPPVFFDFFDVHSPPRAAKVLRKLPKCSLNTQQKTQAPTLSPEGSLKASTFCPIRWVCCKPRFSHIPFPQNSSSSTLAQRILAKKTSAILKAKRFRTFSWAMLCDPWTSTTLFNHPMRCSDSWCGTRRDPEPTNPATHALSAMTSSNVFLS